MGEIQRPCSDHALILNSHKNRLLAFWEPEDLRQSWTCTCRGVYQLGLRSGEVTHMAACTEMKVMSALEAA